MVRHGGYSMGELNKLYPFELDLFYNLLVNDIKKENEGHEKALKGNIQR